MALVGKTITCFISSAVELWLNILICLANTNSRQDFFFLMAFPWEGHMAGCYCLGYYWVLQTKLLSGEMEKFLNDLFANIFWSLMCDGGWIEGRLVPLLSCSKPVTLHSSVLFVMALLIIQTIKRLSTFRNIWISKLFLLSRQDKLASVCAKHVFVFCIIGIFSSNPQKWFEYTVQSS